VVISDKDCKEALQKEMQRSLGRTALAWIIHDFAGGKRKGALKD
jgi:hypothetical protein